jgi:hypothetical protein
MRSASARAGGSSCSLPSARRRARPAQRAAKTPAARMMRQVDGGRRHLVHDLQLLSHFTLPFPGIASCHLEPGRADQDQRNTGGEERW